MIRRRPVTTLILLIVLISAALAVMVWGNYQYTRNFPGGEHFFIDWFSARSLFIDGVNPYSATAQSSMVSFARSVGVVLDPGARYGPPLYAAFLTLPFALVRDFVWARAVWMVVSEGILIGLVLILSLIHI